MTNPSQRWDRVPVYGWYRTITDQPIGGRVTFSVPGRITRVDGRAIYPEANSETVRIGGDSNPMVRSMVRAMLYAADEQQYGDDFDPAEWDAWWDKYLDGAIFASVPAVDDPDIVQDDFQVRVQEQLEAPGVGRTYYLTPLLAHLPLGINLGFIEVPPGAPVNPAPVYAKGIPGGVAGLDRDGDVVNSVGFKVGQLDEEQVAGVVGAGVADYLAENPVEGVTEDYVDQQVANTESALSGRIADAETALEGKTDVSLTEALAARVTTVEERPITTDADVASWVADDTNTRSALDVSYARIAPAATGNATTDTTALQNALNALPTTGGTLLLQRGNYVVNGTLTVATAKTVLRGEAATITQAADDTVTVRVEADDVTVSGLRLIGKGTDFDNSTPTAIGITGANVSGLRVADCVITNHGGAGVRFSDCFDGAVSDCHIVGTGSPPIVEETHGSQACVRADGTSGRISIQGCNLSGAAQGIITSTTTADLSIVGNLIHDIPGQHGMYVGSGTRVLIADNVVQNTALNGIKVQIITTTAEDCYGLAVTSNIVDGTGSQAISLTNNDPALARKFYDVTVFGNTIRNCANSGMYLVSMRNLVCFGNVIDSPAQHGLILTDVTDAMIGSNTITGAARNGILISDAAGANAARIGISGNVLRNVGSDTGAGTWYGLAIQTATTPATHVTLDANVITDDAGAMRYGVFFQSGDLPTAVIRDNVVTGAGDYGWRGQAGVSAAQFHGNVFSGGDGDMLHPPSNFTSAPDTSGATMGELETEVNALKAALRQIGAIRP